MAGTVPPNVILSLPGLTYCEKVGERIGRVEILRYHNEADPTARRMGVVAWLTEFWSAGATSEFQDYVVIVQGMRGRTFFQPSPFFYSDTYFESAFFLLEEAFRE